MSRSKRKRESPRELPRPFTRVMLPDVPGGQEGLLPESTQGRALKVEFDPIPNAAPTPQDP